MRILDATKIIRMLSKAILLMQESALYNCLPYIKSVYWISIYIVSAYVVTTASYMYLLI